MSKYLSPGDLGSFDGLSKKPYPTWHKNENSPMVECPKCQGHGEWVGGPYLKFNCSQCNGYGWTSSDNVSCIHDYCYVKTISRCYHLYQCRHCGVERNVDSGD